MNVLYTKQKTQKVKKWIDALLLIKNNTLYIKDVSTQKIVASFQYEEKNLKDDIITTTLFLIQLQDELQISKIKLSNAKSKHNIIVGDLIQQTQPKNQLHIIEQQDITSTISIEPPQKNCKPIQNSLYIEKYNRQLDDSINFLTCKQQIIFPVQRNEIKSYLELLKKYNNFEAVNTLNDIFLANLQQISCELLYNLIEIANTLEYFQGNFFYYPKNKYQTENAIEARLKLQFETQIKFSKNDLIAVIVNISQFEQQMHLFILDSYEKSNSLEVWLLPFSKLNPKLFDIYNKNGKKLSFIHLSKFQLMLQYFNQLTDTIQRQNFNQFSLNFLKNLAAIYNKNLSKDIQLQNFEYQIHDFQIPSKSSVQLNDYQYKAFKTVIDSYVQENSYQTLFLIRGVFGSGKSQTLVNLIQHLYYLFGDEFKILVTAITNTAIDNILARLSVTDIPQRLFQRLGSNLANKNLSDYQRDTFNPSCFASFVTCSSISKCQCQQFDLVIVDEASQMKEFEYIYISSLVQSHKIILCGDPAQLPPISSIQSIEKSIFQRFIEAGMEVISLWEQYRCNKHISALSSMFFYNGNVVTNIDPYLIILQQKLLDYQFEKEDYDKNLPASSNKIKIKHNFKNNFGIMPPVATFHLKSQDEKCNQSRVNKIEAYSIKDFIVYLLNSSQFLLIQIGVITPYRAQSDFLREMLPEGILVSTVDAFQGDERQIIIFSHVKTENSGIDSFVENGCRVNVALSRAQYSFIVFKGQSCTNGYWGKFQKYSEKNNWIFASIQEFQTWQAQFSNSEYEEIYELMDKPTFVITKPQPVILTENKEQIKSKFKKVLKFQKEDPDRKNWSSWTKPVEEKQVTIQDIEVITLDKCLELLNYNFQHRQLELKLLPCDNYKDILKSLIEFNKSHQ